MIKINQFIQRFPQLFAGQTNKLPWEIVKELSGIILQLITHLDDEYEIHEGIAIHKTATIENGAVLKAPLIIGKHNFIGSNVCLRGGVYLDEEVTIGTGCEIKTSILFNHSAVAHFNFIGDSIIGSYVNFEAGSIAANHYNERENKTISVVYGSTVINTGVSKFGALVGDHSKIGANAVLSPGTILQPGSIVKRLELIDQLKQIDIDQ